LRPHVDATAIISPIAAELSSGPYDADEASRRQPEQLQGVGAADLDPVCFAGSAMSSRPVGEPGLSAAAEAFPESGHSGPSRCGFA